MNLIGSLGIIIICSILNIPAFAHQSEANLDEAQITSVSQLADVAPTDWAFIALQSLVEEQFSHFSFRAIIDIKY